MVVFDDFRLFVCYRYVFFLDVTDPFETTMLCVTKCPEKKLAGLQQVQEFAFSDGSELCRYDVDVKDYLKPENKDKCPKTPIVAR